jgi:hypothetical protein
VASSLRWVEGHVVSAKIAVGTLSATEKYVVDRLNRGQWALLAERPNRILTSIFVENLLLDNFELGIDPSGVNINGATIEGTVDVSGSSIKYPVRFQKCLFNTNNSANTYVAAVFRVTQARVPSLRFDDCILNGHLEAIQTHFDRDLDLADTLCNGSLRLQSANIRGRLVLTRAKIRFSNYDGIAAESVQIGSHIIAEGIDVLGAVSFKDASIGGYVELGPAQPRDQVADPALIFSKIVYLKPAEQGQRQFALNLSSCTVLGDVRLSGAKVIGDSGAINLAACNIKGRLQISEIQNTKPQVVGDGAISAVQASVGKGVFLSNSVVFGEISFVGATIDGVFMANNIIITSRQQAPSNEGKVYVPTLLNIENLRCRDDFAIRRARLESGIINANATHIGGKFGATDLKILNISVPRTAFYMQSALIARDVELSRCELHGSLSLDLTQIKGGLELTESKIGVRVVNRD